VNNLLASVLEENVPKFNDKVVNGFATTEIPKAVEYIDNIIKNSMRTATSKLVYLGWRPLTPKEEFDSITNDKNVKVQYDISTSDLFKIALLFEYNGKPIPNRYLYIPYVSDGGIIKMSGTKFQMTPILSDMVISPGVDQVFTKLICGKIIFRRIIRNIKVNNEFKGGQIVYSSIHNSSNKNVGNNANVMIPPIAIYLMAKLGFKEAFKKYTNVDVVITTNNVDHLRDKYDVYESTGHKPRAIRDNGYTGHNVKLLVPKGSITVLIENIITGIIYLFDIFPMNSEELVNTINNNLVDQEIYYWKLLLGKLIFKDTYSIDRTYSDMVEHFKTLDSYIDPITKRDLAETGHIVEDFYDFLAIILTNYSDWLLNSKQYNNNVFNRYININYYILFNIIMGINKTITYVTNKSIGDNNLSENELLYTFNKQLSAKLIFDIVRSKAVNISLLTIDYPGDNKYPKITSVLELQERANGVHKSKHSAFPESIRTITGPDLFLGSILYLPKKSPTPKCRINPFVKIDPVTSRIKPEGDILNKITILDTLLSGKEVENKLILDQEFDVDITNVDS